MFLPLSSALTSTGLANLVDYGGNSLGSVDSWVEIGRTDVQRDGEIEIVIVNSANGRWATLGITTVGGVEGIDFSQHGPGGDTRVVGIYTDPLVESGQVTRGGPNDSQTRFENDLRSGNITGVLASGDYDSDGGQEVYFRLGDGTAVLHAYMHADGNIAYANYQSQADVQAFMAQHNVSIDTSTWFTGSGPVDPGTGDNPGDDGGSTGGNVAFFVNNGRDNGSVLFQDPFADELYRTDGTQAGTVRIKAFDDNGYGTVSGLTKLGNGRAVFLANLGDNNTELWITDGTEAGTGSLKDIKPGPEGQSFPSTSYIISAGNGRVVFAADDGVHGRELWVTDGTPDGTVMLKDINEGSGSSTPEDFITLPGGKTIFSVNTGANGFEIWTTEGTSDSTYRLGETNLNPSDNSFFNLSDPVDLGSGPYLITANTTTEGQLWVTDGTAAGTSLVSSADPYTSGTADIASLGSTAVFSYDDGTSGKELWVSDGTAAGTVQVMDISAGATGSGVSHLQSLGNGKAVFIANDGTNGSEIWVTDGTSSNTSLLRDINPGSSDGVTSSLMTLGNGQVIFAGNDPTNGAALWTTDGTESGTTLLHDMASQPSTLEITQYLTLGDNSLVFGARVDDRIQLWYTDGTAANTRSLYDFGTEAIPGGYGLTSNPALSLTEFGEGALVRANFYFQGRTLGSNSNLLYTDLTEAGTIQFTGLESPGGVMVLD